MSSSAARRSSSSFSLDAPLAAGARALRLPSRDEPLPAVDERLVAPETRAEIIDGRVYFAPPADEEHGTFHVDLVAALRAHLAPGYICALDMLTRTSKKNDFAPDASVYLEARDPATGGRRLEELAFEIVSKQSLSIPTKKARELVRRGVRRVFCMLVRQRRVLEWSRDEDRFAPLMGDGTIDDRCFVRPLPAKTLLDAASLDGAIIEALAVRGSPALSAIREEGRGEGIKEGIERGLLKGRKEALLLVLRVRGISVDDAAHARIEACEDAAELERWAKRALEARLMDDVFEALEPFEA